MAEFTDVRHGLTPPAAGTTIHSTGKTHMRWKQTRRWIVAALLPVLLCAATASGYSLFRCRYDGIARRACCCPSAEPASDTPTSTLSGSCCCNFESVTIAHPSAQDPSPGPVAAHPVPPARSFQSPVAPGPGRRPLYDVAPRAAGPPILALKHSLLI